MHAHADHIVKPDNIPYIDIKEKPKDGKDYVNHIEEMRLNTLTKSISGLYFDYFRTPQIPRFGG